MSATKTLVDLYSQASPSVRKRGRSWYPQARRLCLYMANEHNRPLSQVVAIFAITSANTQLASNIRFTEKILRGERMAGCFPTHQTPLVTAALATRYPGRFVRGPKVSAFYRAIMGDVESFVLDRWTGRAAGRIGKGDFNKTERRELEAAYREAAKTCGETVRAFQAIVWLVVRESTPNVPRYSDITQLGIPSKDAGFRPGGKEAA